MGGHTAAKASAGAADKLVDGYLVFLGRTTDFQRTFAIFESEGREKLMLLMFTIVTQ